MLRISVICSNYNGLRYLDRCLGSLRAQRGVSIELLVVDRLSTDGSLDYLSRQRDVQVVSQQPETGLVAGYHAATQIASGELFFFCNEDLWLDENCLRLLSRRIDLSSQIGASDPWQWTYDESDWIHGATRFERVGWAPNSPHPRYAARFTCECPKDPVTPFPCAGAFLIHRELYELIGGWDTSFFLDHEDIDIFLRAWQHGWCCVHEPEARVYHAVNASQQTDSLSHNLSVRRRRYVSQRVNLAVIGMKYFRFPHSFLNVMHWPVTHVNNVRKGRFSNVALDWAVLKNIVRRSHHACTFRKANSAYNHYFPGEKFFSLPEFQVR